MEKVNYNAPQKGQIVLAISNGDGSYQLLAMTRTQAELVNRAIASVSAQDEPFIALPIKLIQDESKRID